MTFTTNKPSWFRNTPFHPLLFAAFPILALLVSNITEVNIASGLRPFLASLLLAVLLFLVLHWTYKDAKQAALAATALLILFYSYGHVYNLLIGVEIFGVHAFQHITLLPLWLVLAGLSLWWVSRKPAQISLLTYVLNVMGLVLLGLSIFQLVSFFGQRQIADANAEERHTLNLQPGQNPPDIYYFILDGYGRSDVLKSYGYDNTGFLNALRDEGFFVAECSQSNYAQTKLSLASSLNFNYLEKLSDHFVAGSSDRTGLDALIHFNAVRQSLEKAGYKTVGFITGFPMTQLEDADYYFAPHQSWTQLNGFESLLLKVTFAGAVEEDQDNLDDMPNTDPASARARTLYVLQHLDQVPQLPGPKFVFVHLVIPHPPYVFNPTGGSPAPILDSLPKTPQLIEHYRDQAMYISSRIMEIVPRIIANSKTTPIIVIQGDHGPTVPGEAHNRMKILNAYLLPGGKAPVYPTITPVNTFRIIFNTYFGQSLTLLDDKSLYSLYRRPYNYRVIPNSCQ